MFVTGGPHKPEDGWQTRWVTQAGDLLLQSPLTLIIAIVGVLLAAIIDIGLSHIFPGIWGYVIYNSISTTIAALVPVSICASLGISEGYGTADREDVIRGLKIFTLSIFLINSVILTIVVIMFLMRVTLGDVPGPIVHRDAADLFLHRGVSVIAGGLFVTLPINALWVALVTQVPMGFNELRIAGFLMIQRSFSAWLAIIMVIMLVAQFTLILPATIGSVLMIFLSAWLYVAGREIFGGISSNKNSMERNISLMGA